MPDSQLWTVVSNNRMSSCVANNQIEGEGDKTRFSIFCTAADVWSSADCCSVTYAATGSGAYLKRQEQCLWEIKVRTIRDCLEPNPQTLEVSTILSPFWLHLFLLLQLIQITDYLLIPHSLVSQQHTPSQDVTSFSNLKTQKNNNTFSSRQMSSKIMISYDILCDIDHFQIFYQYFYLTTNKMNPTQTQMLEK